MITDKVATHNSILIAPYGGELVDLAVPSEAFAGLKSYASRLPSIQISPRSVCDLELLATGAISPLDRFMGREDYQGVLHEMHLNDGQLFPIPVTLPVGASPDLQLDRDIALRDHENKLLGIMTVEEIFPWDPSEFSEKVIGTQELRHPLKAELNRWGALNISGRIQILQLPDHYDFQEKRMTPSQTRARLASKGRSNVIAHHPQRTSPPVDEYLLEKVVGDVDGMLLVQLAAGLARLGDFDQYTQIRIYNVLVERCIPSGRAMLSLIPLAIRMTGVRDILLQALISRNYGANHMLVRQSQVNAASFSGISAWNEPQELLSKYSQELGVKIIPVQEQEQNNTNGRSLPGPCIEQEVAELLDQSNPPRHHQGVCIWFTGLSGAGKSTTAEILTWMIMEHGRRVTVLDGDVVRTHLSKGLGFSKEDRDTNVRRIGFVAAELVRIGGIAVCAVVSPYRSARHEVREMVGSDHFVEVYFNTPLEVCEARDVKGMYARARRGELKGFTGVDDPYEPPDQPEITLGNQKNSPQDNASLILQYLIDKGFLLAR